MAVKVLVARSCYRRPQSLATAGDDGSNQMQVDEYSS